jgi:hypothetical protein
MNPTNEEMSYTYTPERGAHGLSESDVDSLIERLLEPHVDVSLDHAVTRTLMRVHNIMQNQDYDSMDNPTERMKAIDYANELLDEHMNDISEFTLDQRIMLGENSPYMMYQVGQQVQPGILDAGWSIMGSVYRLHVSDTTPDAQQKARLTAPFVVPRPQYAVRMTLMDIAVISPTGAILPLSPASGVYVELDDREVMLYNGYFAEESVRPPAEQS